MRRLFGVLLVLAATLVPASGAAAAPAWSIVALPYPTNFIPGSLSSADLDGPSYQLQAFNVGGGPTSGTFTIVAILPGPLNPSATIAPFGSYGPTAENGPELSCKVSGHTVTCTGGGAVPVGPGEQVSLVVPVDVDADAPPLVVSKARIEGGGAPLATTTAPTPVSPEPAAFDFLQGPAAFYGFATAEDGSTPTQAGSHPYQLTVGGMSFTTIPNPEGSELFSPGGGVRDVVVDLPQGLVVNPGATPKRCMESQLQSAATGCPDASQVGTIGVTLSLSSGFGSEAAMRPLYNMVAPPGSPAELGFEVIDGTYVHLLGSVRSDGSFQLSAASSDILAKATIAGVRPVLWGVPSDASHDAQRGFCMFPTRSQPTCPTERTGEAFVTLPSSCGGPIVTEGRANSWLEPGVFVKRSYESADVAGNPVGIDGCNNLEFAPTISSRPTTNLADSPSGLDFNLDVPQNNNAEGLATANLKDAEVTLPAGFAVNPSAASGLDACSSGQIGLESAVGATPIRFREEAPACPYAAKVGSVEVDTPLLEEPLPGAVYLAKPFDNPFGSLLGLYLVVNDPQTGVLAKLAGRVEADPSSGQLSTTFSDNPELPIEDVRLHLFEGARATLTTPLACGTHTTTSTLTPWSTPEGADATPSDSFAITAAPGGGSCVAGEGQAPNAPSFTAGTLAPQAGAYSPFVLKLTRPDGSQRITAINATLSKGLTGKLAGVPYCSEAQIAAAKARETPNLGSVEATSPSCPAASEVGTANVGAGSGIAPLYVQGHAYLAGPYKGAPLSLVIITPAVAGPFDLGAVVVRTALHVDPETAQIRAVSDPLPTILQGIPLDVRSIALRMDRPAFTLNPTSCDLMAIAAAATAATGQVAPLTSPFQVGNCSALPFKPKLSLRLKGGTKRTQNPALTAVATARPGEANIGKVSVALPHSAFLDQDHIRTICTRVQFAAGAVPGENCPRGSIYGKAKAITPLLAEPLSGPVFLRSSSNPLPDLVASLHGQVDVVVVGRVDSVRGGIRNSFEAVPDAPVTKFTLEMQGGKKGLIVNSRNICKSVQRANVQMEGQNGKTHDFRPLIKNACKGKAGKPKPKSASA
jgi:hypothetical protein